MFSSLPEMCTKKVNITTANNSCLGVGELSCLNGLISTSLQCHQLIQPEFCTELPDFKKYEGFLYNNLRIKI